MEDALVQSAMAEIAMWDAFAAGRAANARSADPMITFAQTVQSGSGSSIAMARPLLATKVRRTKPSKHGRIRTRKRKLT